MQVFPVGKTCDCNTKGEKTYFYVSSFEGNNEINKWAAIISACFNLG
jgi:hypothetical protein